MNKLLLTGADTSLGRLVLRALKSHAKKTPISVHLVGSSRDGAALQNLQSKLAHIPTEVTLYDSKSDTKQLAESVESCSAALLLPSSDHHRSPVTKSISMDSPVLRALDESNSAAFVLKVSASSKMVSGSSPIPNGREEFDNEAQLKNSKLRHCILQPNLSYQSLIFEKDLREMICGGTVSLPYATAQLGMIDQRDVADVALKILKEPDCSTHDHNTYVLTGEEAFTWEEIAAKLSSQLIHQVRFSRFPLWAVQTAWWIKGKSSDEIQEFIALSKYYDSGAERNLTTTFEELMNRKPISLDSFIKEHQTSWPYAGSR